MKTRGVRVLAVGHSVILAGPIEGGKPAEILREFVGGFDISPDNRRLVIFALPENRIQLTVCDFPACTNRRTVTPPANFNFGVGSQRFTPDGEGLAYVDSSRANIWEQPLDGGPSRQVTHFTDRTIASFAYSRDKRLAVIRTTTTNDIVLLKGLK